MDQTWRRASAVAICFAGALAAACGDYEIPLRHGYFIARVSSDTFVLVAPDHRVVVRPTITAYGVDGDVVAGRDDHGFYFIVDTASGTRETQLIEREWRRRLQARGISAPQLRAPSRPLFAFWEGGFLRVR